MNRTLDPTLVRRAAAAATVDPRTIERRLRGEPIRGRYLVARIDAALRALGVEPPRPEPERAR